MMFSIVNFMMLLLSPCRDGSRFLNLNLSVALILLLLSSSIYFGVSAPAQAESDTEKLQFPSTKHVVLVKWKRHIAPLVGHSGSNIRSHSHKAHWDPLESAHNSRHFDNQFVDRLSKLTNTYDDTFRLVLVGACDGDPSYDDHLRRYYINSHWRGVLVEALAPNVANLTNILGAIGAQERTRVMHAALAKDCPRSTITFTAPALENHTNAPHWYRWQIGHALPPPVEGAAAADKRKQQNLKQNVSEGQSQSQSLTRQVESKQEYELEKGWSTFEVPCVTAPDVLMTARSRFGEGSMR